MSGIEVGGRNTTHGKTENEQCSSDNGTTRCWRCWEPPKTNCDIRGVPSAATVVTASNGRRETLQRVDPSRESRYSIPSKHTTNIGHHNNTNSTNFDDDDDADNILDCRGDHQVDIHDDDDGTDSTFANDERRR